MGRPQEPPAWFEADPMLKRAPRLLLCGLMMSCTGERPRGTTGLRENGVLVEHNPALQETNYTRSGNGEV